MSLSKLFLFFSLSLSLFLFLSLYLSFHEGVNITGVVQTKIRHSPVCTHCGTNSSKCRVNTVVHHYTCVHPWPITLGSFIIMCNTCSRRHTKYWHGVWTIIQIMYIMAVNTSLSLLLCPTLTRTTSERTVTHTVSIYAAAQIYHYVCCVFV